MPADLWLVPSEPRLTKDSIKFVVQVQFDEVIVVLDFFQCIGYYHYTFYHWYGSASREEYRHSRWRDLALDKLRLAVI